MGNEAVKLELNTSRTARRTQQQPQQPTITVVEPLKKSTRTLRRIEAATIVGGSLTIAIMAIIFLANVTSTAVNHYELNGLNAKKEELISENTDLNAEKNRLSSYERILDIAKKYGLSLDSNRVQSLE
ncbi:MAG: hypothetical protein ACRCWQ_07825 [Bacilli bacterium]